MRAWCLSVIAVAPVLSVVHCRMAERGGKQADLSRKYASCLPVLLSCFRVVVQGAASDSDGGGLNAVEPEPSADSNESDADVLQLHAASTLAALAEFVKQAAVLANVRELEQTAGENVAEAKACDDEVHLVRYLLVRFCLGLLGANELNSRSESLCMHT
jgi:hypothetical protein